MRTGVAQARIARDQAMDAARIARVALAAHWGGNADFMLDQAPFALLNTEESTPNHSPDLTILAAERDAASARVDLAKARAVQDPTLRAGIRRFSDGNDVAVVFGVSIPLAFHDTNRGNIARAVRTLCGRGSGSAAARPAFVDFGRGWVYCAIWRGGTQRCGDGQLHPFTHCARASPRRRYP